MLKKAHRITDAHNPCSRFKNRSGGECSAFYRTEPNIGTNVTKQHEKTLS